MQVDLRSTVMKIIVSPRATDLIFPRYNQHCFVNELVRFFKERVLLGLWNNRYGSSVE